MISDSQDNVLYYGHLASNSASGQATVTIPSTLNAGLYKLKVFSEQCNGDYKTDFASNLVDLALNVTAPSNPSGGGNQNPGGGGNQNPGGGGNDPTDPSDPGNSNTEVKKDSEKVNAFVERMYQNVLKRASDESGKADWSGQLLNGKNCGAGLAQGFILSKEFMDQNVSNEVFVDTLYATFFNRAADDDGKAYWLGELANGRSRTEVLAGFVNSDEFGNLCDEFGIARGTMNADGSCTYNEGVRNFVLRCYSKVLGRNGETKGIEDWCNRINSGELTMRDVAVSFLNSQEFLNKGLNNEDYVKVLYATFLDREPDGNGLADWVGQLERGEKSRDDIVSGFSGSQEFANIMARYK